VDVPDESSGDQSNRWARALRLELAHEHLGRSMTGVEAADDVETFDLFRDTAAELDVWHRSDRTGPRPPGQLRPYSQPEVSKLTRLWATPMYRLVFDPDGRSRGMRRAHSF
jgi:hypothetical protein